MLLATRGLLIRSLDEMESYLREFIWETLRDPDGPMQRHSLDYDLYLPWVHEEIRNAPAPPGHEAHGAVLVDRLLMDAAWSLVQKNMLRPGPRTVPSEVRLEDYGKGFSLTPSGIEWIREFTKLKSFLREFLAPHGVRD
jgi:hypothetical protein